MCWLLAKPTSSPNLLHHHYRVAILGSLLQQHLSTLPSPQPNKKQLPFIAEYLISSFGFSPDRALQVSKRRDLAAIKSPDRPEALTKFLRDTGLSHTQIKAAVSLNPSILRYNVDKTLKPNALELIENGFSQNVLIWLIRHRFSAIVTKKTLSRLLFWRDFVGSSDEALLQIFRGAGFMILRDTDNYIVPRLNILKEYGLSIQDILDLLRDGSRCFNHNLDSLRQTIELIEELGIARGSNIFLYGLKAVGSFRKDKIQKRVELYQTAYGWSKEDVCSAFRKYPYILEYSEEKIISNMKFLIEIVKLEPRSIYSNF